MPLPTGGAAALQPNLILLLEPADNPWSRPMGWEDYRRRVFSCHWKGNLRIIRRQDYALDMEALLTIRRRIAPHIKPENLPYLTPRQAGVLRIIGRLREKLDGKMPTVREIAAGASIQSSNPAVYTRPLIKKGYLKAGKPRIKRSLRLTKQAVIWLERYRDSDPVNPRPPRALDPQSELPLVMR